MTDLSTMNSSTFSGRQFKVFVAEDGDNASPVVGEQNDTVGDYMALDTEGITFPTFSPNQEFEMRSGAGRVAEFGQMFSSSKGVVTEFTISGRLDQQSLLIFMENVTGVAATTSDPVGLVTLATGYSGGTNIKHTDSVSADQFEKTLSFYFQGPTASDSYQLAGCICSNLQITGDMGTASGRYDYSATFRTQFKPTKGNLGTISATIPTTQMFLSDMSVRHLNMVDVGGSSFYKYTPFFTNLSLTIDAPPVFIGAQGSDAEPEVIGRALPEMNITFAGSIKYDEASDNLIEAHRDPNQNSYIQFVGSNQALTGTAVPTDANFHSSTSFADSDNLAFSLLFHKAKLISASVGSGDVASVDFEAKVVDDGTNPILSVATGDSNT